MNERPVYNPEILALQEEGNGFMAKMRDKLYLLAGRTVTTRILKIVEVDTCNGKVRLGVESEIVTPDNGKMPELSPGDRISRTEVNILASTGYMRPYTAIVGSEQNGSGNVHRIATTKRPTPTELRFAAEHMPGQSSNGHTGRHSVNQTSRRSSIIETVRTGRRAADIPLPTINSHPAQAEPSLQVSPSNTYSIMDSIDEHMTLNGHSPGPISISRRIMEEYATPSVPPLPELDTGENTGTTGLPYPKAVNSQHIAAVQEFQQKMPGPTPPEAEPDKAADFEEQLEPSFLEVQTGHSADYWGEHLNELLALNTNLQTLIQQLEEATEGAAPVVAEDDNGISSAEDESADFNTTTSAEEVIENINLSLQNMQQEGFNSYAEAIADLNNALQ